MTKDTDNESDLFRAEVLGIKPLKQDKIAPPPATSKQKASKQQKNSEQKQIAASFQFSDQYQAYFPDDRPLQWAQSSELKYQLKKLRRGDYVPELILDLHGFTKANAKLEIAALLLAAEQQHCACISIMHGKGLGILREQVPSWLVQHPKVLAFHEAPLQWGGKGALLALMDIPDFWQNHL